MVQDNATLRSTQANVAEGGRMSSVSISMNVNGKAITADVPARMLLVDFLRIEMNLTGTHIGCDTSQCGACNIHVDGRAVKSCTMLAVQADGADLTTIEGVANGENLHPMQAAFKEHHALQCGFCTPGMVMTAIDLVSANADPSEQEIRDYLEGNFCRCTG